MFENLKSLFKELKSAKASKKEANRMLGTLSLSRAKKRFKVKYGRNFSMKMLGDPDKLGSFFKEERKKLKERFF